MVVGFGIAGATLSYELIKLGHNVTVMDKLDPNSSSQVAAGLISPIVPKGVLPTWRYQHLFPGMFEYYRKLEKELNAQFLEEYDTIQIHPNIETADFWNKRANDSELAEILSSVSHSKLNHIQSQFGYSAVKSTGRLNFVLLINELRHFVHKNGDFVNQGLDFANFKIMNNSQICLNNIKYDSVIFCEGIGVLSNPYFKHLFFNPTAGDILELHIPGLNENHIIKGKKWLIPTGNQVFLAGSTYHRTDLTSAARKEDEDLIVNELRKIIEIPITVLSHKKAIRPTVVDRRPYVGRHPDYKNLWILNGLGSKGGSLCSLFAPELALQVSGLIHENIVTSFRPQ